MGYAGGYGHDSYQFGYHGSAAPLKHDGTVDYTPEVKKARAEHFAALHAHNHGYPQYAPSYYSRDYSHSHTGGYSHDYKYRGPTAPLKYDGTVDDLPEVKAARAHHLAEYAKVLYSRRRRGLYGYGAPLKHDGTVDDTPEVKHAKAVHLAAVAHAKARAYSHPYYNDYYDQYYHHRDGHGYHGPHAPLNHDGTVADTPAVKHAKAVHFAAHREALSRLYGGAHYASHYDHAGYGSHYSHHDYPHKYYGPPAPLNHDGTVAETPEVKHAKAVHFQLYNEFLHRHKRAAVVEPPLLRPDGTARVGRA